VTALPLTMLFHEGPIARAYLARLSRAGQRVQTIIQMIPPSRRALHVLPSGFRQRWAANRQNLAAHYWPRVLADQYPELYRNLVSRLSDRYGLDDGFFAEIRAVDGLEDYAETVLPVEITGVGDPRLPAILERTVSSTLLYTGGGMVPRSVFDISGLKILHVHPCHFPHLRGADGLLWSTLARGRPGVSCFVMRPGLDMGDVVEARDIEALTFDVPPGEAPNRQDLYRMLFSYYDPVLRADLLLSVVADHPDPREIIGRPQDLGAGLTYHFMEPRLQALALAKIFRTQN